MQTQSILFLGSQMAIGGAQHVLLTQAQWFYEKGYRVTVAFFYDKENLERQWQTEYPFPIVDLGVRVTAPEKAFQAGWLRGLVRLWVLMRQEKVDIIETFTPHSNLIGLPLALAAGIPARVASHHGKIENIPHWMERLHGGLINIGIASALVAVSPQVVRLASDSEKVKPNRVSLIANGVRLPQLKELPTRARVRLSLDILDESPLVITVGRLTSQKGHIYLLQAVPAILRDFPDTHFVFVGDGPLRVDLEQQADRLGCKENTQFLGNRSDIAQLLHAADIFVLPSISEGMPMALLEAMGMGVAVVASNLEGIAAVVEDGVQGLLVPPTEVKSLTFAISRLLKDAQLRETLAQQGQILVSAHYTVDRMCERYEKLFQHYVKQEQSSEEQG